MRFTGSFVALVTPFDRKGRLDRKTLEQLVEWHIQEGTDGIVCAATTGESPSLSTLERKIITEICVNTCAGRIPVIAATGVSSTTDTVKLTTTAQKIGADGCLVVTPYYNKPSQRGCVAHFAEVAKVGLPVIVYHNPARAVVKLSIETVALLAHIPGIVGMKDSSADLEYIRKICKLLPVFAGDDDMTLPTIREGGVGCIGVVPNIIPRGWKKMVKAALQGNWALAGNCFQNYLPLIKAIFTETNPQGPKFALSWLGRCEDVLRLPMVLPLPENQAKIKKELVRLSLPFLVAKEAVID